MANFLFFIIPSLFIVALAIFNAKPDEEAQKIMDSEKSINLVDKRIRKFKFFKLLLYWCNPLFYILLVMLFIWSFLFYFWQWVKEVYNFMIYLITESDWM